MSSIFSYTKQIEELNRGILCRPQFATFHITNVCNQKCLGCAYGKILNRELISKDDCYKIINELIGAGVRAFEFSGGGEPLMLPYIGEIFDYVKSKGCFYALISNGTLLTKDLMDQIIDQATYIRISLESSCREDYIKYKRVSGSHWDKVIDNLKYLSFQRREKNSKCDVGIKFSVGKSAKGLPHITQGIELSKALGVNRVTFKSMRHEPEELSDEEKIQENKNMEEAICAMEIPESLMVRHAILPVDQKMVPQCKLTPLHTVVDFSGNMYLCCYYYLFGEEKSCIGNLLKTSFEDIWHGDRHAELRRKIDKNICSQVDCKFFYHHKAVKDEMDSGSMFFL